MGDACVLALDVGGSSIDYAIIGADFRAKGGFRRIKIDNTAGKDVLLGIFTQVVDDLLDMARKRSLHVTTCSLGFPDPCDYQRGIPLMKHKFQKLYGFGLKHFLEQKYGLP